jgi:hypothetical protein
MIKEMRMKIPGAVSVPSSGGALSGGSISGGKKSASKLAKHYA